MKVIVVGGSGTIGSAVSDALSARHEVIKASRTSGELQVDISSAESIKTFFGQAAPFDAVVSAAGDARFKPLSELTDEDFEFSVCNKLMGQVNLVRFGMEAVSDGGSFTLTSGVLAGEPMAGSAAISLVNAGIEGFVRAAALEAPRGIRVNVVSPPWVTETLQALGMDLSGGRPAADVARAYVQCVEGSFTGRVFDARQG